MWSHVSINNWRRYIFEQTEKLIEQHERNESKDHKKIEAVCQKISLTEYLNTKINNNIQTDVNIFCISEIHSSDTLGCIFRVCRSNIQAFFYSKCICEVNLNKCFSDLKRKSIGSSVEMKLLEGSFNAIPSVLKSGKANF